ncbi:MAG: BrnT family toxin [Oscillospiraceae bacterium]|nr:BrnT family toxin [Oscillospiraceae bacterium]
MTRNMFEWDENKNQINIKKHGVDFNVAWTAFNDVHAIVETDYEHSYNEERQNLIGFDENTKLLFVCHCERGDIIRLISARKADKFEIDLYWSERGNQ